MPAPDVSLVVPVRDEAGNIGPLVAEIRDALDGAGLAWELFIVDDGSADESWTEILALGHDARVKGVRLARAGGKSAALAAGLRRCRGPVFVMLDGDGQDDPAEIPRMVAMLGPTRGHRRPDLVNGWKTPRRDPWHKTIPSRVFNALAGCLTGLFLHDHNCGLKAMRIDVARGIPLEADMHRFITIFAAAAGYRVVETPVHHRPRLRGASKYGMSRFTRGVCDLARVAMIVRGGQPMGRVLMPRTP